MAPRTKTTKTEEKKKVKKTKPSKEKAVVELKPIKQPELIEPQSIKTETENGESEDIAEDKKLRLGRPTGPEKYYESVGRRKEATARVRVLTKKSTDAQPFENKAIINVNDKPYYEYFKLSYLQDLVDAPLKKLKSINRFKATVKVNGGGLHGQADAIKFGLSRALILFDPNFAKKLRKAGYLTRDSREKERRKYGLKKARKAPQWAKR